MIELTTYGYCLRKGNPAHGKHAAAIVAARCHFEVQSVQSRDPYFGLLMGRLLS